MNDIQNEYSNTVKPTSKLEFKDIDKKTLLSIYPNLFIILSDKNNIIV